MNFDCPYCFAAEGEEHARGCVRFTPDYSYSTAPYELEPVVLRDTIAGKQVALRLEVQDDATPRELIDIWLLIAGRVKGNRLAFIYDKNLIRHFVEVVPQYSLSDIKTSVYEAALLDIPIFRKNAT